MGNLPSQAVEEEGELGLERTVSGGGGEGARERRRGRFVFHATMFNFLGCRERQRRRAMLVSVCVC